MMSAPIHSSALICKHSLGLLRGYIFRCASRAFRGCICMCFSGFLEVVYIMSALSFTGACAYTSELAFDVGIGFIYNGDSI